MTHQPICQTVQRARLTFEDSELFLIDILSIASKRDSYQEFRGVVLYSIAEYPDLFVSEDFSKEQVRQIEDSFRKESYADFRQVLIPVEACCGTFKCPTRRKCPNCRFLEAARSLSYEEFRTTLAFELSVD